MPTIEVNRKDLERLVGKKLPQKQLEECLMFVKGEIDDEEECVLKVDVKETNRPDLWSTEGIAREIRTRLGLEKGIRKYRVEKAKIKCTIEKSVEKSRPFIACAVIKGVKISEDLLIQMIQLQEKVGMTYGRKRKETGIGLYDYDIMKPPMFFAIPHDTNSLDCKTSCSVLAWVNPRTIGGSQIIFTTPRRTTIDHSLCTRN